MGGIVVGASIMGAVGVAGIIAGSVQSKKANELMDSREKRYKQGLEPNGYTYSQHGRR